MTRQLCVQNVMKIGSELNIEESTKFIHPVDEFNVNLTIVIPFILN